MGKGGVMKKSDKIFWTAIIYGMSLGVIVYALIRFVMETHRYIWGY